MINRKSGSTRASLQQKGATKEEGPIICYQTTAGALNVIVREICTNARVISVNFSPDTGACKQILHHIKYV